MYDIVLAFITAFLLVYLAIPSIINIARVKHLYDVPDQRKVHTEVGPYTGWVWPYSPVSFSASFFGHPLMFLGTCNISCAPLSSFS
jgi:UDP-N-acetylmuramyl pentapeptide phosphotransferase/UDP-N-acetylglucosamine-1-phosphate transferase